MDYLPHQISEIFNECTFNNRYNYHHICLRIDIPNKWGAWLEVNSNKESVFNFVNYHGVGGHLTFSNVNIDNPSELIILKDKVYEYLSYMDYMGNFGKEFDMEEMIFEKREQELESLLKN